MLTPIGSTWLRSPVSLVAIALAMGVIPSAVRSAEPEDSEAEAALKRFADRLTQPSGDRTKLREEILDFRLKHPGTPLAARASGLLSQLRSPLDKLDSANIPPLERFPSWQPKELVGVVGEHRGRHAAAVSCVAFSPDGTMAASGGGSYVRLWDAATLRLHSLVGHYAVTSLAVFAISFFLLMYSANREGSQWGGVQWVRDSLTFSFS